MWGIKERPWSIHGMEEGKREGGLSGVRAEDTSRASSAQQSRAPESPWWQQRAFLGEELEARHGGMRQGMWSGRAAMPG